MKRLNVGEIYRQSGQNHQYTPTTEEDPWKGLPYRPNPDCTQCKGAGYVYPWVDGAIDTANLQVCQAPGCLRDSIIASMPRETVGHTFENFVPVPGTEKALKHARALASGEAEFFWLLIYGNTGCGKTHLGNAITTETRRRGLESQVLLAGDFFSLLKEGMKDHSTDQILRRFKEVAVLVIDDYGVEYGSEWEMAKFDELMTHRFAMSRITVLLTNKDIEDLPERIRSRFQDRMLSRICHNKAPDYRKSKKTGKQAGADK